MLDRIVAEAFPYFVQEANPRLGLIRDKTDPVAPASIASVGLALTVYPAGVERGLWSREEAVERTLATLRFFQQSLQSRSHQATGYRGFYYHFLDMNTGRRTWNCELSTIDTALFIAGALYAAEYFDREDEKEAQIRKLADFLYRRIDWNWALNRGATVSHGWKPETGFLHERWQGYNEALLLYALALGSPTHPIPPESYQAWLSSCAWKKIYGTELLYAGPLFIHQLPQVWIDLRGIQDELVRKHGLDYFENSRRATVIQQEYAIRNPRQFRHYGKECWGITASDGPGPASLSVDRVERQFYGYLARGAPFGPDDGTVSPWAVVASLPFAPNIVLPTMRYLIEEVRLKDRQEYGFEASFNATFPEKSDSAFGWVSPWVFGLNQGPIVLMIENFRNELIWSRMRGCLYLIDGLRRAGFRGGWLEAAP
jgi:hypothetical protein